MYAEVWGVGARPQPGSIQSRVAIANPSLDLPVVVNLELSYLDGVSAEMPVAVTIPPGGQFARFVEELFPELPTDFRGFLKLTASSQIGVMGLRVRYNERRDLLVTSTPASNDAYTSAASELVFPLILSGAGFTTEFVLYGQSSSGQLRFVAKDGTLLTTAVQPLP